VAESKGIQSEYIPKIATGFCSGISRTSGMCGAVSGTIMALNLIFGRDKADESIEKNYACVQKFVDAFENEFGSTNCRELVNCDLNTKEGQNHFKSKNLITKCHRMTEEATRMAMEIIEGEG
jgi:C_GCAxxG_C_C family probable redox protein